MRVRRSQSGDCSSGAGGSQAEGDTGGISLGSRSHRGGQKATGSVTCARCKVGALPFHELRFRAKPHKPALRQRKCEPHLLGVGVWQKENALVVVVLASVLQELY